MLWTPAYDLSQADGRVIKVYPKPRGYQSGPSSLLSGQQPRRETRQSSNIVDGSMGFPDSANEEQPRSAAGPAGSGLYSDKIIGNNRRGRDFRGGRGGSG